MASQNPVLIVTRLSFYVLLCIFYSVIVLGKIIQLLWTKGRSIFDTKDYPVPNVLQSGWKDGFIQLSEIQMHYIEAGSPDKPLMILVHGFPEFWYSFRYQIRHFERKYHVIAVDLRGYGQSDKPSNVAAYKLQKSVEDISELIQKLSFSKKAVVVGHDWGAIIAWMLAAQQPEIIDHLVVLSVPHLDAAKQSLAQFRKSWYVIFFQCPFLPEIILSLDNFYYLVGLFRDKETGLTNSGNFTDEDANAWRYFFKNSTRLTPPIGFYRAFVRGEIFGTNPDWTKMEIKPKTLVILGDSDMCVDIDQSSVAKTLKHCENGRVIRIPEGSHWIQQDFPELVNRYIEEFLAGDN